MKGYLTRAAAAMPEEDYSFKPAPDIRTFGALLGHIADHQMSYCSTARGAHKQGDAASKTTKADLVAALAASFAECDAAWDSVTAANATEMVGQRSKLGTLILDVVHGNEGYGYMAIYFRPEGHRTAFKRPGQRAIVLRTRSSCNPEGPRLRFA